MIYAVRVSFLTFREKVLEIYEDFRKKPVCLHMRPFNEVVVLEATRPAI